MNTVEIKKAPAAKKPNAASLRVKPDTRKRILSELTKVNRKTLGRKVRVDQLLNLLISLIRPEHIQKLQDESLSNSDRIEMKYRDYIKKHGPISKDEFLGVLMRSDAAISAPENAAFSEGEIVK